MIASGMNSVLAAVGKEALKAFGEFPMTPKSMPRISPSTAMLMRWLLMQISPAELHRLGLIASPDLDLDLLGDADQHAILDALLDKYSEFTEAHKRLLGKGKPKLTGSLTLTQEELGQVMEMRARGLAPEHCEAVIRAERLAAQHRSSGVTTPASHINTRHFP